MSVGGSVQLADMKLAVVFWFYKEVEVCRNRLQWLKKTNPDLAIFGLFGGDQQQAVLFQQELGEYLDDFYVAPMTDANWKWLHGDLVLLDWYEQRGQSLEWDSVVVVQWDLLVFAPITKLLPNLQKDQLFLSGYKVLDPQTEQTWDWTMPGKPERVTFERFMECVRDTYHFTGQPTCCLFIFVVWPRVFFKRYAQFAEKELGMLEYKIPILASLFGLSVYDRDLGVAWGDVAAGYPLNAFPQEIEEQYIKSEIAKPNGWRLFHPYFKEWQLN